MKVLITGGSGYLGQFLLADLCKNHQLSYTYRNQEVHDVVCKGREDVRAFKVDFETGEGINEALEATRDVDVVVNCAALSQTGKCEEEKDRATKINVPTHLVNGLLARYPSHARQPLLVHLSTDQVYDGSKPYWKETDDCIPVNHYGKTKVEAENLIKSEWRNYVILRSSLIYGSRAKVQSGSPKFIDFVVQSLRKREGASFFSDEFRCPIFVEDIVKIVQHFIHAAQEMTFQHVFNMGGPERLNRVEMARLVADSFGIKRDRIHEAKSADVHRAAQSPLDISMDSSALVAALSFDLTTFADALSKVFPR